MDWYPRYPSLWRTKTRHLDPFQEGCYLRLVDEYMETRQPLPDNDHALARIIGISLEQWLGHACGIVRAFFVPQDGMLFHDRCDKILAEQDAKSRKQSEKSKKGAEARWRKNKALDAAGIQQAMPKHAIREEITREEEATASLCNDAKKPVELLPEEPKTDPAKPEGVKSEKPKRACQLSDDWKPHERHRAECRAIGLDADTLAFGNNGFRNYHQSKGNKFIDWDKAFFTWIGNATRFGGSSAGRSSGGGREPAGIVAAGLRVAARYEKKLASGV